MRPRTASAAGSSSSPALFTAVAFAALLLGTTACGAVYPELQTPLRAPPNANNLDPAPGNLRWIGVRSGTIPETTRDGRKWHELGSPAPDPYVILFVNGKELLRTDPQASTLAPTWPDAPKGNFRWRRNDRLKVEIWESGLLRRPICQKDLGSESEDWLGSREILVQCEGGATLLIGWELPHARFGYGFYYEFRSDTVYVTRVFEESPATKAGMQSGDQIISLGDRAVKTMKVAEVQSYLNSHRSEPIRIEVKHPDKQIASLEMKEGAVYPTFAEFGTLP